MIPGNTGQTQRECGTKHFTPLKGNRHMTVASRPQMAERHFQRTSATQSGLITSEIPSNDDQRMIRMKEGDTNAFEELIEEWQGPLLGFFLRKTGDRHLSEDLVQETLLRLYRSVSNYVVMNQFRGFLFRIARNLLMDHSRRAERNLVIRAIRNQLYSRDAEQLDPTQQIPEELLSPADAASKRELAESVQMAITQLPESQRQTLVMHHFQGLTLSEIADAMEIPLPTAKSRLHLAKVRLCHWLTCRGLGEEFTFER